MGLEPIRDNAGDIIRIRLYDYYNYSNYFCCYFSGFDADNNFKVADDAHASTTASATYGYSYTIPTYSKSGYTFVGYYTGENGTGTKVTDSYGNSLQVYSFLEDITLYPYYI